VKVIIGVVILYGVLRCIMHVGVHVFVTSPVVLLDEERPEPVSLVFHIAVKTVALLIPYIIASISWIEFQVVIATMFGFIVKYRCTYYAMLSICVAIFAMSAIAAVALLGHGDGMTGDGRQDDGMAGDGHGEELQTFSFRQRCCAGDRKKHKPPFDATARRVAEMEHGAGQGLWGQPIPSYGGCEARAGH